MKEKEKGLNIKMSIEFQGNDNSSNVSTGVNNNDPNLHRDRGIVGCFPISGNNPPPESSSTSSIGKNSDDEVSSESSGGGGGGESEEVQSALRTGGLDNLEALEEALPIKYVTRFYFCL